MKEVSLTIKNYRCFADSNPAHFVVRNGLMSFVGVNNIGKTSILRFFYEFRTLFTSNFIATTISNNCFQFIPSYQGMLSPDELFCNKNNRDLEIELELVSRDSLNSGFSGFSESDFVCKLKYILSRQYVLSIKLFNSDNLDITKMPNQQFPQMLEVLQCLSNNFYIGAFRNVINPFNTPDLNTQRQIQQLHTTYYDLTIGAQFIHFWKEFKTGNNSKQAEEAIKLTEEIRQIFKLNALDISPSSDERNLFFTIDNKRYTLSELGSGIAQFFLVLANIAMRKPSFILIDEPEINLHPSLQIEFLNILERYSSNGVLYATHSVGLARHADQIYSVFREKERTSSVKKFEKKSNLSELLGELSYSVYRELGFDKVLLVEGRTEIKVVQQFLRKYNKDNNFFIVALGGSQYISEHSHDELREFLRTSDKIFALIDSEKDAVDKPLETSRQKFVANCKDVGIECHVLEYRATENYFPERVIKIVKGDKCRMLEPYEKLDDRWAKTENWQLAQEMRKEELEATDLGIFIKKICEI
jgi:AAA15 family ATPase/GTPase